MAVPAPPAILSPIEVDDPSIINSTSSSSNMPTSSNPLLIPSSNSTSTDENPIPNLSLPELGPPTLEKLLHQPLQLTLSDRRIISGLLLCIDKEGNIILRDTKEYKPLYPKPLEELTEEEIDYWDRFRENREAYWPKSEPFHQQQQGEEREEEGDGDRVEGGWGGRDIGMVCIKRKDVRKIEVKKDVWRGLGGMVDGGEDEVN